MATQIDLGAVVPIGKGDWDINTTYERANIVRHNSVAWICKVESSTGVEPTEDSSDWYLLVKDTSSVTSVNGQKGDVNLDIISSSQVDNKINTEINNVKLEINSKIPSVMVGASDEISGKSGLVPKPKAGDEDKFLKGDGKWSVPAYLPLTGGTLIGSLDFNVFGTEDYIGHVIAVNDQYGKRLIVDTYEEGDSGAFINLFKGSSEKHPGGFELGARNAEDSILKILEAKIDGNLLWDGKQIVRSVNGVTADSTGNTRTTDDMWVGENSGGFTMPWDGFVIGRFAGGNGQEFRIYRNDNEIFYCRNTDNGWGTLNIPFCIAAYVGEWVSAANNAWYGVRAVRK